jgi:hypothetical protein
MGINNTVMICTGHFKQHSDGLDQLPHALQSILDNMPIHRQGAIEHFLSVLMNEIQEWRFVSAAWRRFLALYDSSMQMHSACALPACGPLLLASSSGRSLAPVSHNNFTTALSSRCTTAIICLVFDISRCIFHESLDLVHVAFGCRLSICWAWTFPSLKITSSYGTVSGRVDKCSGVWRAWVSVGWILAMCATVPTIFRSLNKHPRERCKNVMNGNNVCSKVY